MIRYQIILDPIEADVLARWAASEMRDPRDQIRFIIRRELERRGLLHPTEEFIEQATNKTMERGADGLH